MHDLVVVLGDLSSNIENFPKTVWAFVRFTILAAIVGAVISAVFRRPDALIACLMIAFLMAFLYHQQDPAWASWFFDVLGTVWDAVFG